jgi:hypothetical protein
MKKILGYGAGLALAMFLTTTAKAQMAYYWVPYSGNGVTTSGTLNVNAAGQVTSLVFYDGTYAIYTSFSALPPTLGGPANGYGTQVLGDNDIVLTGVSLLTGKDTLQWDPNGTPLPTTEQNTQDAYNTQGDWVPVPEPSTLISGAMLLLPFGASTLRILRRKVVA